MQHLEVTFKNGEVYFYPADERGWASGVRGGRRFLLVGYAMIPEDVVERWRLVEPAPVPDGRCPSVMDRKGAPGADIRCALAPGHAVCHRGYDRLGNELQWLDAPDPAEVEDVVQWAERQAQRCAFTWTEDGKPRRCDKLAGHDGPHERAICTARAWLRGVGYSCETPASYPHTEHGNAGAGLMWAEVTS